MRVVLVVVVSMLMVACSPPVEPCAGCRSPSGQCVSGQEVTACGSGGAECSSCTLGQVCSLGRCVADSTMGGGSGATGGGDGSVGGGSAITGGGDGSVGGGSAITGGGDGSVGGGSAVAGGGDGSVGGGSAVTGGGSGVDAGMRDAGSPGRCSGTLIECNGICVDTATSLNHCGGCDNACGQGLVCNDGTCAPLPTNCVTGGGCAPGYYCDEITQGCKVGCRLNADCPSGGTCNTATHTCSCPTQQHACGQACVSNTSADSCGALCTICPRSMNGVASCSASSMCQLTCSPGFLLCGGDCSPCTVPANASPTCAGSACSYACNSGFHQCADQCASNADVATCGSSCTPCPVPANAVSTCTGGACGFTCNPGFVKCANGCCGITQIAAGDSHTCAVTSAGTAKCWGLNSNGQLGTGNNTQRTRPTDVSSLTTVSRIIAANQHSCALTTTNSVKCWGDNSEGQLGNGTADSNVPLDVANTSGTSFLGAANWRHTCLTFTSGAVRCWGSNLNQQLGNASITTGATMISEGLDHTCAIVSGSVRCWGNNSAGQLGTNASSPQVNPVTVPNITATSVSTGTSFSCAVTTTNGLKCWGINIYGQLGDNSGSANSTSPVDVIGLTTNAAQVSAGNRHVCAVTTAGGAKCWGNNQYGQLGDGSVTQRTSPVDVVGLTSGVASISAGTWHTCAVLTNGGVKCWGYNANGRLGDGSTTERRTPVFISGE